MSDLLLNTLAAYHGTWRASPKRSMPSPPPKPVPVITMQEPEPQPDPIPIPAHSTVEHPATTIKKAVCRYYEILLVDLISDRRFRRDVRPRQVAMYLCRILTTLSYPQIGAHFGGRDHTTVMSSVRKVEELMTIDIEIKNAVDNLSQELAVRLEPVT